MSLPQKQTRPRVSDEECVHRPVLALSALELAVERAGTGSTSCRCGCGADLTVQCQVDGGADPALLQIHTLRAPLVTQIRRHEQRAGEGVLGKEELNITTPSH